MKVELVKTIIKTKKKYSFPAQYVSHTKYKLYIDDVVKQSITIGNTFNNVKQFLKFAKEKYNFEEYSILNHGTYYQDYQAI